MRYELTALPINTPVGIRVAAITREGEVRELVIATARSPDCVFQGPPSVELVQVTKPALADAPTGLAFSKVHTRSGMVL